MGTLTELQLGILSKINDLQGKANMDDLTNRGCNLEIPEWDDEVRELFQEKFLEINGAGYKLTSLGKEVYETYN